MANNTPIDLTDEIALRRYLLDAGSTNIRNITYYNGQFPSGKAPSLMTSQELSDYVKGLVEDFDTRMYKTINEVKYSLATLIPDENTIVKTIEDELAIETSNISASVASQALVAIDTDGSWAKTTYVDSQRSAIELELTTNYATVDVISGTYATQTSVGAIYEVSVEANGNVSGYRSVATGESSAFQIYAEQFAISSSSTEEGYSPFQVDTVNGKINMTADVAIDGSLVIAGTITANAIAANTITTAQLDVIDVAYFTNTANTYTDDTVALQAISDAALAQSVAGAAQIAANTANIELANIASDNILSPVEKSPIINTYATILGEQAGIDSQATTFGITTEKNTYDTAISALTTYLGTLLTPVAWNNLSGDTGILGSTFRQKFLDVYTSRQALLNAISLKAKVLADNAQTTANSKTTLAAVQAIGYVVPSEVANAINTNTTTISGSKITTGTISALQIAANTITADKMSVTNLSSISANIGTITAGTINASVINAGTLNIAQIPAVSLDTIFISSSNNSESTEANTGYDLLWAIKPTYTCYLVGGKYVKFEYAMNISSVSVTANIRFGVLLKKSGGTYSIPSSINKFFQLHKGVVSGDVITGFFYLLVPETTLYGIDLYLFNETASTLSSTIASGSSIRITQNYK